MNKITSIFDSSDREDTLSKLIIATATSAAASALVANDISYIKSDIKEIKIDIKEISGQFITKAEFDPVKKAVYGLISTILVAVVGAIMAIIVIN